jgi:O-antigen/teichoic acid export membrane protein
MFRLFRPTLQSRERMRWRVRELLGFSVPAVIAGTFAVLVIRVDRLMVGALLPAQDVGIYQAASQASVLFAIVPNIFSQVIAPRVAELYAQGEIKRLDELFKLGSKWSFYLAMPIFLAVCAAPAGVMRVLYGIEYQSGAWPLVIMCTGLMSDAVVGAAPTILVFCGRQKLMFAISASALISTIVLNYLLVPRFRLVGGALAAALVEAGMLFAMLAGARSRIGVWPYDTRWLKGMIAALCAAGGLWMLRSWMGASAQLAPILSLIVAEGIFWTVLLLCGLDAEDMQLLWTSRA